MKSALRLTAVDEAAAAEGLSVGMTLADARAQVPTVRVARVDAAGDLALLERLAEACRRYTPALALHPPQGVDLDVTGCTGLFGGETALLAAMAERFTAAGFAFRVALADTPGLAWAVARHGPGGVSPPGAGEGALALLPIAALGLEAEAAQVLDRLGLKRIGQLEDLPRAALARRLGEAVLQRLDAVLGRRADPLETRLEPAPLRAERRVFEPLADEVQVLQVTADLAADLGELLARRGLGGRRFVLELFRVDGAVKRLQVAASRPLADPRRIADLFAERLAGLNEGLEADFGFDQFRLCALGVDVLAAEPRALLAPPTQGAMDERTLSDLADRVAARTGTQVLRPAPGDAHAPERADRTRALCEPLADWGAEPVPAFEGAPLRPLRLFTPPQPVEAVIFEAPEGAPVRFTWRRVARTVIRSEGPERLEPQWALQPDGRVRDYYRLEDDVGRRYWLFREGRHDAPDIPPPGTSLPPSGPEVIKPVRPEPGGAFVLLPCAAGEVAAKPTEGALQLDAKSAATPPPPAFAGPPPPLRRGGEAPPVDPRRVPRIQGSASTTVVVLPPPASGRLGARDAPKDDGKGDAGVRPSPRWFIHGLFG